MVQYLFLILFRQHRILCAASLADGSAYLSSLLLYAGGALSLTGFLLLRIANGLEAEADDGTIIGPAE